MDEPVARRSGSLRSRIAALTALVALLSTSVCVAVAGRGLVSALAEQEAAGALAAATAFDRDLRRELLLLDDAVGGEARGAPRAQDQRERGDARALASPLRVLVTFAADTVTRRRAGAPAASG